MKKIITKSLAVMLLTFAGAVMADNVSLVATLKNAPAFTPVHWTVVSLPGQVNVATALQHSLTLDLTPGTYKATATLRGVSRDRTFTADARGVVNVVIALD